MAYIRSHETKQRARGKTVKTYAVVYRAKVRTDDGRMVSRLRQETHATKAAAEARVAELNAHRHSHTTDPAEQRKRGQRSLADWSADWLASQRVKVAGGQLKARTLDEYGRLLDCYVMPELGHVPIAAVTPAQLEALIGELAQINRDAVMGITSRLPLVLTAIAAVTLTLLFFLTGSIVLPLKALVLNVLSLTAAFTFIYAGIDVEAQGLFAGVFSEDPPQTR